MKAPGFWYRPPGLAAGLLAPLGALNAGIGQRRRRRADPFRAGIPVICVGNLVAGGAGKTPVAIAVARHLIAAGLSPHFLSRGYGGRLKGPLRVDPERHDSWDVGDEPLLLAAIAPCWVARDRAAGARAAAADGAGALVMDDGFQNPSLHKDVSLVVVDGESGFGNGRPIPAGPLREGVADGIARADAVVLMGEDRAGVRRQLAGARGPLLRARLAPTDYTGWLTDRAVVAFAGIARPEKFFALLGTLGARLVARVAFGDHQPIPPDALMRLADLAADSDALLVTTAKDHARLPLEARGMVKVLAVEVAWEDEPAFGRLLQAAIEAPH